MCGACNELFSLIGQLFGWILWFFYSVFKNYGVAIILFAIVTRLLLFPLNIKQQKSQAAQSRLQPKLQQLQNQYGNDREGYNQAVQELYAKEGVSPGAGCMPMLIQMPLLFGLYEAIRKPLSCMLHLKNDVIIKLLKSFKISTTEAYSEIKLIEKLRGFNVDSVAAAASGDAASASGNEVLNTIINGNFSAAELADIDRIAECGDSFKFLCFDLLETPSLSPITIAVLMSVIVFITSVGSMYITNKINKIQTSSTGGCNTNIMSYGMAAMSTWFSFMVPVALALYWVTGNLISPIQTWISNKYFGKNVLNAKAEAQRIAMIKIDEQKIIDEVNAKKGQIILKPDFPKEKFEGLGIQGGSNSNKKKK